MKNFKYYILIFAISIFCIAINAQTQQKKVSEMTNEQLMELTYDDLLNLSFEDLIVVANKFGLSADELLEYFLNKDVTSASKHAEKSFNSPLSSTVISRDEILNSGATNIPEALRLVPGMIVREKTPGNYDVHIRGNDNVPPKNMFVYSEDALTLVMIDGRPVYNYSFGGTFWESLPIEINDIDRIEVIRGPSSALYGPNAVSGAINIFTRNVNSKKLHADGQFQLGSNDAKIANIGVSVGASDNLKFRVSGNYTKIDRFENDFFMFKFNKKFTKAQIDTMKYWWKPEQSWMPVEDKMDQSMPDASLATDKYGINAFADYAVNKNIGFNLATGTQNSDVITTSLGNHEIPQFARTSNSSYIDLRSRIYGFQAQANYLMGDQWIENKSPGWRIGSKAINASLEYEHKIGTLVLRPGISYQSATYDDSKYIDASKNEGFLNGPKVLNSFAYFLRADYRLIEKLRLIAALRGDKYNKPDKNYLTYQFIASYDINDNNIVRAVYSRANRGPFIVDNYANYNWVTITLPGTTIPFNTLYWRGNQNLNLPVMDMIELGYRTKVTKNVMVDLEAFQTTLKNFSYFLPDSLSMYADFSTPNIVTKTTGHLQYYNMDLKSVQSGITCNVSVVVNKQLNFKVFGTLSQTKLTGFYPKTIWQNFDAMTNADKSQIYADGGLLTVAKWAQTAQIAGAAGAKLAAGQSITPDEQAALTAATAFTAEQKGAIASFASSAEMQSRAGLIAANGLKMKYSFSNTDLVNNKIAKSSLIDTTHVATPSFYGGADIDYTPIHKVSINASAYFYSKQIFLQNRIADANSQDIYTIKPKVIISLKVSYKFWKENSVFFNARNLFNNDNNEFAYMDKVGGLYLIGLNLGF